MGWPRKALDYVASLEIQAEPIVLLMAACNSAVGVVTPTLTLDKVNRTYPPPPDVDPNTYSNKWMVYWNQQYSYVNTPISCIMGVVYGGFSDKYGRKIPLLVGLVSVMIATSLNMLILSPTTDWPFELNYPLAAVCGFFGDFSLTMTCVNSYLTDQFPDKKRLSFRMVIVSIAFSVGNLAGAQLADQLIKIIDYISLMGIALGLTAATFIYGVIFLKWRKPRPKHVRLPDDSSSLGSPREEEERPPKFEFFTTIKDSFLSLYEAVKIFVIKREGHLRMFLYVCFLANFLDQFIYGEEKGLIGTYTKLPPFNWDAHALAVYKSIRPIVQIIGMCIGLAVFKKVFSLRDTACICLAIGSMGMCVLVIGLAQSSWLIYVSLIPEAFHGLLNPLTYTFMSCIVHPDEIGKAYAVSSIAQQLASIAQSAILQNIYKATVDWYMGFVWILMSGIAAIAVALYTFVHFLAKKEGVGS